MPTVVASIGLQRSKGRAAKTRVLYDGQCPLCVKSVYILTQIDWLKSLAYIDASRPEQIPLREPPLDPQRLMQEMHVLSPDGRRVYHGFEAFRFMAWRLPIFWLVLPFLYLPGAPELGQRFYVWLARNRYHLIKIS